ncbi:MAG: hypothetical protein HQM08_05925 [Candidatus Riflebacteria bacterium]|nr:hypothetical protein [Candidatus Riflebacteria bacterium]
MIKKELGTMKKFRKEILLVVLVLISSFSFAGIDQYNLDKSWGSNGKGDGEFINPCGIAVDSKDALYVCDAGNRRIQKLSSDGKFLAKLATANVPRAVVVDVNGEVYVAEEGKETGLIEKFDKDGKLIKKWDFKGNAQRKISRPGGLTIFGDFVYLGNNSTREVQKFSKQGEFIKSWGNLSVCCGFLDLAADSKGNIFVAELGEHRVCVFDTEGKLLRNWGKYANDPGCFTGCCNPVHLAIGPKDQVFTAEKETPRVQLFENSGKFICAFGQGVFSKACGYVDIAVDSKGTVYVVDDGSCKVHVFSPKK